MTKNIGLDFDGVLHKYDHHWKGADVISGEPVEGAIDFLRNLCNDSRFKIYVLSSRSNDPSFKEEFKKWLNKYGLEEGYIRQIEVVSEKPPLWIYIDDRVMQFKGLFPDMDELNNFKAWDEV